MEEAEYQALEMMDEAVNVLQPWRSGLGIFEGWLLRCFPWSPTHIHSNISAVSKQTQIPSNKSHDNDPIATPSPFHLTSNIHVAPNQPCDNPAIFSPAASVT